MTPKHVTSERSDALSTPLSVLVALTQLNLVAKIYQSLGNDAMICSTLHHSE